MSALVQTARMGRARIAQTRRLHDRAAFRFVGWTRLTLANDGRVPVRRNPAVFQFRLVFWTGTTPAGPGSASPLQFNGSRRRALNSLHADRRTAKWRFARVFDVIPVSITHDLLLQMA